MCLVAEDYESAESLPSKDPEVLGLGPPLRRSRGGQRRSHLALILISPLSTVTLLEMSCLGESSGRYVLCDGARRLQRSTN